jgi:hypothetical protein
MENIGTIVLATGALGTAAFGIVEALKWTKLGEAGFAVIVKVLGPLVKTQESAYGPGFEKLLRAQYRGDQRDFARVIRQGARVGLTSENAGEAAEFLKVVGRAELESVATSLKQGTPLSDAQRNVLGRYELAVDARIDAALTQAQSHYAGTQRSVASIIALVIAVAVGLWLRSTQAYILLKSVLVGIAAVPLAPIAKDLVSALQAASTAIRTKP